MEFLDDDADLGTGIGSTLPASTVTDEDDIWDTPPADDTPAPAVSEVLSPWALAGLKAKLRKQPLSAQANEWVINTLVRAGGQLLAEASPSHDGVRVGTERLMEDLRALLGVVDDRELVTDEMPEQTRWQINSVRSRLSSYDNTPKAPVTTTVAGVAMDAADPAAGTIAVHALRVADIDADPTQARDEGADDELAASIASVGVLTPIRVYEHPTIAGRYMIDDGERRYRGTRKAGLGRIPAMIVDPPESEGDKLLRQVSANEGKRLKPMEEARSFKRIMADKRWNLQELATALGKPKSTVSDRVALAEVPAPFVSHFEKGHLTAAAAPILRQLESLPERTLARVAESFAENWNVEDAINDGKPVPLRTVEQAIDTALSEEMREIAAILEPEYKGKVVFVGKRKFAVDVSAYDALEKKRQASAPKSAPAKREPDVYQRKQLAEQKKAREKSELRRLQIRALSAKLPTSLGGSVNQADGWSLFLVKYLVREMTHDTQRSACKLLGLEPPKAGTHQGYQFDKAILKYADGLKAPARVQLALQLLLAHDMYVSPNYNGAADRINDAAKLAKFNLATVKTAETSKTPVFNGPAGSANKKKGSRAFMQPQQVSDQLAVVIGKGPMVRTEVTKKLWAYIKREGLQNKKERRLIDADDKLKLVFGGKKQVSMFEMTKLINKHLK